MGVPPGAYRVPHAPVDPNPRVGAKVERVVPGPPGGAHRLTPDRVARSAVDSMAVSSNRGNPTGFSSVSGRPPAGPPRQCNDRRGGAMRSQVLIGPDLHGERPREGHPWHRPLQRHTDRQDDTGSGRDSVLTQDHHAPLGPRGRVFATRLDSAQPEGVAARPSKCRAVASFLSPLPPTQPVPVWVCPMTMSGFARTTVAGGGDVGTVARTSSPKGRQSDKSPWDQYPRFGAHAE